MKSKQVLVISEFEYKNGKIEFAAILGETPFAYFVQFNNQLFGTIYKDELKDEFKSN